MMHSIQPGQPPADSAGLDDEAPVESTVSQTAEGTEPEPQRPKRRWRAPAPVSTTVAISARAALGYDRRVFTHLPVQQTTAVVTMPRGLAPLPLRPSGAERRAFAVAVVRARTPDAAAVQSARAELQIWRDTTDRSLLTPQERQAAAVNLDGSAAELATRRMVAADLSAQNVDGVLVPGGQDIPPAQSQEALTRRAYERALVFTAATRGVPMMAFCGGSRTLAEAFGAQVRNMDAAETAIHEQPLGTAALAHGLNLVPATFVAGASQWEYGLPIPHVDAINSTHSRTLVVRDGEVAGSVQYPATGEPVLQVSAWAAPLADAAGPSGAAVPEAVETRHGVPLVGVAYHPEAIAGASTAARQGATQAGRDHSDALFLAFRQARQAHQARQTMNVEFLNKVNAAAAAAAASARETDVTLDDPLPPP